MQRWKGVRPETLAHVPSDQRSLRRPLLACLKLEGGVEVLLDHDLEPLHEHGLHQFANAM